MLTSSSLYLPGNPREPQTAQQSGGLARRCVLPLSCSCLLSCSPAHHEPARMSSHSWPCSQHGPFTAEQIPAVVSCLSSSQNAFDRETVLKKITFTVQQSSGVATRDVARFSASGRTGAACQGGVHVSALAVCFALSSFSWAALQFVKGFALL